MRASAIALVVITFALRAQDQAPAPAATPAPPPADAPTTPEYITGTVDFGYRWVTDVAGSFDTYRSVVNLGSGPKLFGANVEFIDPTKQWFDKLNLSGVGWGGDPYATARIDASKERWYRFTFDYRSMAYFDALPSFANPFAANGVYLDQRAYDTWRRLADFSLELKPGSRFIPYFGSVICTSGVSEIRNKAAAGLHLPRKIRQPAPGIVGALVKINTVGSEWVSKRRQSIEVGHAAVVEGKPIPTLFRGVDPCGSIRISAPAHAAQIQLIEPLL